MLATPVFAADPDPVSDLEIETRRQQVFDDPSLQTELPGYEDFCRKERSVTVETRRRPGERDWRLPDPPSPAALGTIARILQWAILALGAVALAIAVGWLIRQLVAGRRPRATPRVTLDEPEPTAEPSARPRTEEDLDELLRRGDYGAAVHLLLLRSVHLLVRRGARRIPAGHTSREVLAGARLEPPARGALGELVSAVERSLFGGRMLDADDFTRCREAFGTIERSLGREPAGEGS